MQRNNKLLDIPNLRHCSPIKEKKLGSWSPTNIREGTSHLLCEGMATYRMTAWPSRGDEVLHFFMTYLLATGNRAGKSGNCASICRTKAGHCRAEVDQGQRDCRGE